MPPPNERSGPQGCATTPEDRSTSTQQATTTHGERIAPIVTRGLPEPFTDEALKWEAIRLHARNCVGAATATTCRLPGSILPSIGHTFTAHLNEARQRLTQPKDAE